MANVFNFPDITKCWYPVKFKTTDLQYQLKEFPVLFNSKIKFNFLECLKDYKSVSVNKKAGVFLTNFKNPSDFLEEFSPEFSEKLTSIRTLLATKDIRYEKILQNFESSLYVTDKAANASVPLIKPVEYQETDVFTLNFIEESNIDADNEYVSITANKDNSILTWFPDPYDGSKYKIGFKPKIYPDSRSQTFSYLLSEDGISLFIPDSQYSLAIRRNVSSQGILANLESNIYKNSAYEVVEIDPRVDNTLPSTGFLKFVSTKLIPQNHSLKNLNSHLVKYQTNILNATNILNPDSNYSYSYAQNYLGLFPVESPSLEDGNAVYELNYHGLKNYQTPEYGYSLNSNLSGNLREYERIFAGTNQTGGLENLYLGYAADSTEKLFKNDTEVAFSYPPTAGRKSIHLSNLGENGATAGHHPFVSDRIYLRQIDYKSVVPDYVQPPSISKFTNTWLCSWYSLADDGTQIWKDRFYNAAYYTVDEALSAQAFEYKDKTFVENNYIYDVPSNLYLEPGAFYRYYRTGVSDSKKYLSILDEKADLDIGSKVLEVSSWNSSSLIDYSGYNNNGSIYNANLLALEESYLTLNGSNHVVFPANQSLLDAHKFSVSMWVNVENWANISGRQIFGNFYNSGYGLLNESAIPAALLTFVNATNGEVYSLNYNLKISSFSSILSSNLLDDNSYYSIHRLPDLTFWIFNKKLGTLYKFDAEGKLILTIKDYYDIEQVETDHESNLYLYAKYANKVFKLNYLGNLIDVISLNNLQTSRIELFLDSRQEISIIEVFGNASVIDNNSNVWQSLGSNLYKSPYDSRTNRHGTPTLFAMVGDIQQLSCDASNNIWILHDQDYISVMSQDGSFKSVRLGKRAGFPIDPCQKITSRFRYINFVRLPEPKQRDCKKYSYTDFAILIDIYEKEIYVLNEDLELISKLNLLNLPKLIDPSNLSFFAEGDFTGFQNLRKFYLASKKISWKLKIGDLDNSNPEILSLSYNSEKLKPGWHHFALTFDSNSGSICYFIDSVVVSEKRISPNKNIIFDYHSSLLLGADSIKNTSLNDVIGIQDSYKFEGKVAELKVYNKSLSKGDVKQLYLSSSRSVIKPDLVWNMPTGSRNYIEEINHWFQMQLPGSKSKYFNINIHNFPMIPELKPLIEDSIRKNISKLSPAHTSLHKINWL